MGILGAIGYLTWMSKISDQLLDRFLPFLEGERGGDP